MLTNADATEWEGNTFDAINYINTFRILMILVPLESAFSPLLNDTKIIKIRETLI